MITGKEKALSVMCYFSWVFLLIAYFANQKESEFVSHHFMQGLVLQIYATLAIVIQEFAPEAIGGFLGIVVFAYLIWGVVYSIKGKTDDIPGLNVYKSIKK